MDAMVTEEKEGKERIELQRLVNLETFSELFLDSFVKGNNTQNNFDY